MITLDDLRAAVLKRWDARMWIGGQPCAIAGGLPARTLSALRQRSIASVELVELPPTGEQAAFVDLILNETKVERFFTGKTDQRGAQAARMGRTANLIDTLNLDRTLGVNLSWSHRGFVDAVRDVFTAAGLGSADIDSIFDPGGGYALGPSYAIKVKKSENIGQILKALMDFGGTACYVTPSGRVRVVDNTGVPASTSAISYAEGANLGAGEFGITDAGFSLEGNERAVSVFTATGPKKPDGSIPDGTYTASGVTGRGESVSYPYLQSDTQAQVIAQRELSRRARDLTNVWFEAPLNPLIQPSDTILFRCARIGYAANTPATITEVATTADGGMRVQLSLGPSLVDGYASSIRPPVADFSMQIEQQLITLAGVPVTRAFVQCRDQSRDRSGYAITARAWTASGPGASPTSASDTAPMFFFSDLAGASISLNVTSASGEAATVTKAPRALDTQIHTRVVSVAGGANGWQVLATVSGWRSFAPGPDCTAVPPINETGPLWAGFADGAIYQSADALATTPTLSTTLGESVGCLWVNEADPNHILAGHGASLSRTANGGASWAIVHTFGATVADCQSSPRNPGEIRVCAGETARISYDGGATWATLITGATGSTAAMIASAPWGHAVAITGVAHEADSLIFEEGYAVDWTGLAEADRPASGLASITPLLSEQGYLAGECADLVRDGALDSLILSAGAGRLWKLLWGGAWFVAGLLPAAAAAGPGKVINAAAAYPIGATGAVRVGYGALGAPPVSVSFLRLPSGCSGAADCLWIYTCDTALWSSKAVPEAGRADWRRVVVNPFNRNDLLLYRWSPSSNRLWYSPDGGTTWTSVFQDLGMRGDLDQSTVEWSTTTDGYWFVAQCTDGGHGNILRGFKGASYASAFDSTTYPTTVFGFGMGLNDEIVLIANDGTHPWLSASFALQPSPGGATSGFGQCDRLLGTRQTIAWASLYPAIVTTTDYTATAWQSTTLDGQCVAVLADGTAWLGARNGGIVRVDTPWGTPATSTAYLSGTPVGHIRSDRRTQTALACVVSGDPSVQTAVRRGAAAGWATIDGPVGVSGVRFADWVEVIA